MHAWMANDQMSFVKQHHTGVNYIDAGFFIKVLNRDQMDDHHTKTLAMWLGGNAPKFQLKSKFASARSKDKGYVKMRVLYLMCTEEDQVQLSARIAALNNHTWIYTNLLMFNMLSPEAKIKLFEPQGPYNKNHFNFLVEGFKDTSERLMMNYVSPKRRLSNQDMSDESDENMNAVNSATPAIAGEDPPPDVSIKEFILNFWVDNNNNLMYRRIGPVIEGSRELTIHRDNVYQKDSLKDTLFGDLYHYLTADAANKCFDVAVALKQIEDGKTKAPPQSPDEFLAANLIVIDPPINEEKSLKRLRSDDSPATTATTTTSTST